MAATPAKVRSVCVYCGSSNAADPAFLEAAAQFGRLLAADGRRLVYGGGRIGLMGAAGEAAHTAGGKVLGVIPEFLCREEIVYDAVKTVVVKSMHERKLRMFDESDAFAVLPGGIGTLEEVVELTSWARLGLHRKPIVFLNLAGYWEPYFALIRHTVEHHLSPAWIETTWRSVDRTEDVLPMLDLMAATADEEGSEDVVKFT